MPDPANPPDVHALFACAMEADDAPAVARLFELHPEFKALVNAPIGPFDSPAILHARGTAMLDVLLAVGADLNAKSQWWAGGFGLLHSAPPDVAAYAIERGAHVDACAAARLGLRDKLREILAADPRAVAERGGDGQTPLHFASNRAIAELLLSHGAEIDAKDVDHESTPAQYMLGDRTDVAHYLVSRGCRTDLLMVTALGDETRVREFLDRDPDSIRTQVSGEYFPMIGGKAGGTIYQWTLGFYVSAFEVARNFGHERLLELLYERAPTSLRLIAACSLGDEERRRVFRRDPGENPIEFTPDERCQLAHAARNNETRVVRALLEAGLPVTALGQHGATPLHWAAFHGNATMAKVILPFHPPLEDLDADFRGTPLGWAIHGSRHGWYAKTGDYAATIEALLEAGVQPPSAIDGSDAVRAVLRRHFPNLSETA